MQRQQDTMDGLPAGIQKSFGAVPVLQALTMQRQQDTMDRLPAGKTDLTAGSNRKVLEQFQCCRP